MFKPKTLLKVVSIIMIISAVLGIIGTGISVIMLPKLNDVPGVDMSAVTDLLTPVQLAMSVASSICCIAAGIFGVSGKSFRWAMITAGIYSAFVVVGLVQSAMMLGFQFLLIFNLIIPLLYWWGLYQSKE